MADLHRRAAQWYRRNGWLSEAVRHAGDSGDWQLAARIVLDELAVGRLLEPQATSRSPTRSRACRPAEALTDPQPLLVRAALELSGAGSQPGGASLGAAESLLGQLPADAEVPARLAAALIRLALSRRTGDQAAAADAAPGARRCSPCCRTACWPGTRGSTPRCSAGAPLPSCGQARWTRPRSPCATPSARWPVPPAPLRNGPTAGGSSRWPRRCAGGSAAPRSWPARPAAMTGDRLAVVPAQPLSVALAQVHLSRGELKRARGQLKLASAGLRARPDMLIHALACLVAAHAGLAEGRPRVTAEMADRARQGWSLPAWLEHRLAIARVAGLRRRGRRHGGDRRGLAAPTRKPGWTRRPRWRMPGWRPGTPRLPGRPWPTGRPAGVGPGRDPAGGVAGGRPAQLLQR